MPPVKLARQLAVGARAPGRGARDCTHSPPPPRARARAVGAHVYARGGGPSMCMHAGRLARGAGGARCARLARAVCVVPAAPTPRRAGIHGGIKVYSLIVLTT